MKHTADIVISGAGLNGLAMALALGGRSARRPLTVTIVDAIRPERLTSPPTDGRASAITATSRAMFEALGVWEAISHHAEAMREIIVTDAKAAGIPRPALLSFQDSPSNLRPSAYLVENRHLHGALLDEVTASPAISLKLGAAISSTRFDPGSVQASTGTGDLMEPRLIIAADGRNSTVRQDAGIETVGWSYGQTAIVTTVAHELPHDGTAEEHFLPSGPFAILPLLDNRSSLVWTESEADAQRIMALDEPAFLEELSLRFGTHRGAVSLAGPRQAYPLSMMLAKRFVAHRLALIGDAAHVVHPIAGLGFNLGLRDAAALAECIARAHALGLDIGGDAVLQDYEQWRRFDTVVTALATDGLNRLFANNDAVLRPLRDAGLMAVNRLTPLKGLFMREAAGKTGRLPKLMRGEAV